MKDWKVCKDLYCTDLCEHSHCNESVALWNDLQVNWKLKFFSLCPCCSGRRRGGGVEWGGGGSCTHKSGSFALLCTYSSMFDMSANLNLMVADQTLAKLFPWHIHPPTVVPFFSPPYPHPHPTPIINFPYMSSLHMVCTDVALSAFLCLIDYCHHIIDNCMSLLWLVNDDFNLTKLSPVNAWFCFSMHDFIGEKGPYLSP